MRRMTLATLLFSGMILRSGTNKLALSFRYRATFPVFLSNLSKLANKYKSDLQNLKKENG